MAQIAGVGTVWNLPNYFGELFTADMTNTPILNALGGMDSGRKQTSNFEFVTGSEYDFPTATQPAITETGSLTAPTATAAVRGQDKNVTQIFQQAVNVSYAKLSNTGRLSGVNTAGTSNNVQDELDFQTMFNLAIIARNVEYTIINGTYQISTGVAVANKTRGLLAVCDLTGSTAIDALAGTLTTTLVNTMLRTMFENGAPMQNLVIYANAAKKQKISSLYELNPRSRVVGGNAIDAIVTDFGEIGIMPPHRFMTDTDILCVDMNYLGIVTQPVPGKGNMFYEPLAKTGAAEQGQVFGQLGLDHGPAFAHGKIENLAAGV